MEILKQVTKRYWVVAAVGFILVVLAIFSVADRAKAPTATPNSPEATSTTATTTRSTPKVFPINAADDIVSWNFKGSYAGQSASIAQANADIARLTNLLGKGEYDDYDLYVGIGNDFNDLGDGHSAYRYYNRAIAVHPTKGLAYVNLGHLFDELGAYATAADAYTVAVAVEPDTLQYRVDQLTFLTERYAAYTAKVTAAFDSAEKAFGDSARLLQIKAQWYTSVGRYADAIAVWQQVKALSVGKDTSAIDAEIARLQAKLQ